MIHIYDTLSQSKKELKPLIAGQVGLYVCGVTVYDACHLGHGRTYAAFDVVHRYLKSQGLKVHYIRNITDVDDKIIVRAKEKGMSEEALTAATIENMQSDFKALRLLPVSEEPRATNHIQEMLSLIRKLSNLGYAYQGNNGDVYFDVAKDIDYGALSHQDLAALQAGARVDVDENKKNPLDFVLWKAAKSGEPSWDSPWGQGRPGWHIECSAMAMKYLGPSFDIHGGGRDLMFPHHENERAQSEQANGQTFVNHWMHAGYLEVDSVKMSKSLGNFLTIRDALAQYHPEVLRYFFVSSHYRSPAVYSDQNLKNAKQALDKIYQALRGWVSGEIVETKWDYAVVFNQAVDSDVQLFLDKFQSVMNDDFNTPMALSVLFDMLKAFHKSQETDPEKARGLAGMIRQLGIILGILQEDPESYLTLAHPSHVDAAWVEEQIAARKTARDEKNWAKSDEIRKALEEKGVIVEDGASGSTWRFV